MIVFGVFITIVIFVVGIMFLLTLEKPCPHCRIGKMNYSAGYDDELYCDNPKCKKSPLYVSKNRRS